MFSDCLKCCCNVSAVMIEFSDGIVAWVRAYFKFFISFLFEIEKIYIKLILLF